MSQLTGRVKLTIDGQLVESNKGAKLDPGGITRTAQTSGQRTNFTEALRPAKISAELPWKKGLSLTALNDLKDTTFQFICDTGDSYVISNGFRSGDLVASSGENSSVPIELEGDPATEVLSA